MASRRLTGNVGYVAVRSLAVAGFLRNDPVDAFDRALDGLWKTRGLVLDLRGNGGGNSLIGDQMVGRLVEREMTYGRECYRAPHPMHAFVTGCQPQRIVPRRPVYTKPVAVLLDGGVHSSAEWMAASLCTAGRARCFGETTAGNSGDPAVFFLSNGVTVRYSTASVGRAQAERPWRLPARAGRLDHRRCPTGRDPVLEAAHRWIARGGS